MNTIAQKFSSNLLHRAFDRLVGFFEVSRREMAEAEEYDQRVADATADLLKQVDSPKAKRLFCDI